MKIKDVDLALCHMYILADWGHFPLIVSDGDQFLFFNAMPNYIRCISSCSVLIFKCKLDLYLRNIVDIPGRTGFNNSLDSVNGELQTMVDIP